MSYFLFNKYRFLHFENRFYREQASLFSRMGFDGLFFGRLDWRDKGTFRFLVILDISGSKVWVKKCAKIPTKILFCKKLFNLVLTLKFFE